MCLGSDSQMFTASKGFLHSEWRLKIKAGRHLLGTSMAGSGRRKHSYPWDRSTGFWVRSQVCLCHLECHWKPWNIKELQKHFTWQMGLVPWLCSSVLKAWSKEMLLKVTWLRFEPYSGRALHLLLVRMDAKLLSHKGPATGTFLCYRVCSWAAWSPECQVLSLRCMWWAVRVQQVEILPSLYLGNVLKLRSVGSSWTEQWS